MNKDSLSIGDSIRGVDRYKGEGENIVTKVTPYGVDTIFALNTKYPSINGNECHISNEELKHYEKVKTP